MRAMDDLNYEQSLFVYEFLKDQNRTRAAIRVGKPEAWAATWGSKTYKIPKVRKAIDDAMTMILDDIQIDAKWILQEYTRLYNLDLSEILVFDEWGEPRYDFNKASPDLLSAIESIDISPGKYGTKIKVTLPTKAKILEMAGKHVDVNAFKEHVEHTGAIQVVFDDQDREA